MSYILYTNENDAMSLVFMNIIMSLKLYILYVFIFQ